MQFKAKHIVNFARQDSETDTVLAGWEAPVGDLRWARVKQSKLTLPRPQTDGMLILLLTVEPFLFPPLVRHQTLRVQVNGITVRLTRLAHRTSFACRLGADMLGDCKDIGLTFEHPDMIRPDLISNSDDSRYYSIGFVSLALLETPLEKPPVRPAAPLVPPAVPPLLSGLTDAELLGYFCSLGDNCEFGLTQRRAGIEPMDLLRFSGIQFNRLLDGIASGFDAMEDCAQVDLQLFAQGGRKEYVTRVRRYNIETHTGIFENEMQPLQVMTRELKKFKVLRRLFLGDLAQGNRIFIYKCNDLDATADLSPLLAALRRWGDASLLAVVRADAAHPPGTAEMVAPGLMRGYLDRFNPYSDATLPSSPLWLDVCRAAYELWRAARIAAPPSLELLPA